MDNYGPIGGNLAGNLRLKDGYGRLWTNRSALQNRWLPAHFLSSPKKNTNVERLVLHCEWQER